MLNKLSSDEKRIITILVMMSFFSGIFISYYVSYISAVFVKIAGVDNLPLAYIVSGLGGMLLFNKLFPRIETLIQDIFLCVKLIAPLKIK